MTGHYLNDGPVLRHHQATLSEMLSYMYSIVRYIVSSYSDGEDIHEHYKRASCNNIEKKSKCNHHMDLYIASTLWLRWYHIFLCGVLTLEIVIGRTQSCHYHLLVVCSLANLELWVRTTDTLYKIYKNMPDDFFAFTLRQLAVFSQCGAGVKISWMDENWRVFIIFIYP